MTNNKNLTVATFSYTLGVAVVLWAIQQLNLVAPREITFLILVLGFVAMAFGLSKFPSNQ